MCYSLACACHKMAVDVAPPWWQPSQINLQTTTELCSYLLHSLSFKVLCFFSFLLFSLLCTQITSFDVVYDLKKSVVTVLYSYDSFSLLPKSHCMSTAKRLGKQSLSIRWTKSTQCLSFCQRSICHQSLPRPCQVVAHLGRQCLVDARRVLSILYPTSLLAVLGEINGVVSLSLYNIELLCSVSYHQNHATFLNVWKIDSCYTASD